MKALIHFIVCFSILTPLLAFADKVDANWERQVSERLAEKATADEVLWLDDNGTKFLGLFNRQIDTQAKGAIIILHAMGGHADWPQTIAPLRAELAKKGWSTLSIQLPVIEPEKPLEDYGKTLARAAKRVGLGIDLLRERKFLNIVAIGHSFGAVSVLEYLQQKGEKRLIALAAIGLHNYAYIKPSVNVLKLIEKISIPMLDIYGGRDFRYVIQQADDRRLAAKKGGNTAYEQVQIDGADHYFNRMEPVLVKRIRGWLDKAAPGVSIIVDKDTKDEMMQKENPPVTE